MIRLSIKNFADGLTKSIIAYSFNGTPDSLEEKIAFILYKCEEKGIAIHRGNIQNWITDKNLISGSRSREFAYLLYFALDYTIEDVAAFLLKVYFECLSIFVIIKNVCISIASPIYSAMHQSIRL